MGFVEVRNLPYIQRKDVRIYEAFKDVRAALVPETQDPPPQVTAINVVSLGIGAVDVTFADGGAVNQQVNYFVEHADNPDFRNPRVEHFGPSRNRVIVIGSPARYFRVYSQYLYPPSQPNAPVNFGGATPTGVAGGGTSTPALQASTGSGTGNANGQQGSVGFGKVRVRPTVVT
jgi:hypothetical protein